MTLDNRVKKLKDKIGSVIVESKEPNPGIILEALRLTTKWVSEIQFYPPKPKPEIIYRKTPKGLERI